MIGIVGCMEEFLFEATGTVLFTKALVDFTDWNVASKRFFSVQYELSFISKHRRGQVINVAMIAST
jgi:hypothetical protein